MQSDATTALLNKDYASALKYAQQILASNPNNTQAIYTFAQATLGNAGLDFASLVTNLIQNQNKSSSSIQDLKTAIISLPVHTGSDTSSLLPANIKGNEDAILNACNTVLGSAYLLKIIKGTGDGVIKPNDPDTNINIAFCLVLRAAIIADKAGVNFQTDYTSPSTAADSPQLQLAAQNVVSAYQRLLVVVNALNLSSNATISKINTDIHTLYDSLPAATKNLINISTDYYLQGLI